MTGPGNPAHWLPRNHGTWTPASVIILDSETTTITSGADEIERLRCWAARITWRRHRRKQGETETGDGLTGDSAAELIDSWACTDKSAWLYAHNAGFDLITTRLPAGLARLGWELSSRHAVTGTAPWIVLHKDKRERARKDPRHPGGERAAGDTWQHTLTIADSFSLLPVQLAALTEAAGISKPPLPAQDAPAAEWLARCHADVRLLSWAVLALMDWWDAHDLGKWTVTGASIGWNTYRHTLEDREVVIDHARGPLDDEHHACYGGRRHVYRAGRLPEGRYIEADFESAYPVIAMTHPLPRKRLGKLTPALAGRIIEGSSPYGMIARCVIETGQPLYPYRDRGRVWYPVGRYATVLAGPEVADAAARGHLVSVDGGWFYSMSGHMQDWARWVLSVQRAQVDPVPVPVRIWAKAASRSVCGKWAQRGWSTDSWQGPPSDDWSYEDCWIAGTDASASITGLAGTYYLSVADQDGRHEFPAVLAYIESLVRIRLNRALDLLPESAVIQCDTDGAMISLHALGASVMAAGTLRETGTSLDDLAGAYMTDITAACDPLVMRVKREYRQAVVYGPQHVILDGRPRFSGVPASARPAGDGKWSARLWPGMSWQIQHGTSDGYVRPVQPYLVTGPYAPGWVLAGGAVRPVEAAMTAQGTSHLVPWAKTRWAAAGDVLAPVQGAWAGPLMGGLRGRGDRRHELGVSLLHGLLDWCEVGVGLAG